MAVNTSGAFVGMPSVEVTLRWSVPVTSVVRVSTMTAAATLRALLTDLTKDVGTKG